MRVKKIIKPLLLIFLFIASSLGLYLFCEAKTHGFRLYQILSNLPNDPRWEVPPLSELAQAEINKKLDQPFTFLGSGGWCYAFLGQDEHTVLKFYKHTHLELKACIKEFSWKKFLLKSPRLPEGSSYFQELNFNSCILLYKQAKERTGLLYVHLNKTQGLHNPVTLIDPIGVKHTLDLDRTEFVLQTKAELILPHLNTLMEKGEVDSAKTCIKEIITCLAEFHQKGIRDLDRSFRNNFGYIEEKAVALDLSSFVLDPSSHASQDIRDKTHRLERYLRKYHPVLHLYYQDCINQLDPKEPL